MSSRELIALGTSSQTPTRERSHNAYMLRWDGECFLFDPGEGAQRQLILANIAAMQHPPHLHHTLSWRSLPRSGGYRATALVRIAAIIVCTSIIRKAGKIYIERLCGAAIFQSQVELELHPVTQETGKMLELRNDSRIHAESSAAGPFGPHNRIQAGGDGAPAISARKTRSTGNPRTYGG